MDRKKFLQHACGMGLCSCAVASLFTAASARAEDANDPAAAPPPPNPEEDWRIPFVEQRYAKLLGLIAAETDESTLNRILEGVGRYCASTSDLPSQHAGDPEGYVAAIREQWKANVTYDAAERRVSLSFSMGDDCPCVLVKKGVTPVSACQCSVGLQKHAFGLVFGQPVEVELKQSLLRGGSTCAFEIRAPGAA